MPKKKVTDSFSFSYVLSLPQQKHTIFQMSEKKSSSNWLTIVNNIAADIEAEAAVLLLGPDALRLRNVSPDAGHNEPAEMTYRDVCRQRIEGNEDILLESFYERDNFFIFKDNNSKKKAKRTVCALAKDNHWRPDETLLTRIAEIPFPIVISVNADLYLRETLEQYEVAHQYDFYSTQENKAEKHLETPTPSNPLIYNLCGSVEDANSLVLDYHDLFGLMKNLLSETKFPQKLKYALKNTTTYVFLGFQFDRWYAQLLLHYLNMLDSEFDNSSNNYSMLSEVSAEDTHKFVVKQFNIQYIGADPADFDRLYEVCRERNLLRTLPNSHSDKASAIRRKAAIDDLQGALSLLENHITELEDPHAVVMLQGRLSQWQKHQAQKTVSLEQLDLQRNQLRYAIVELAAQLL